MPRVFPRNDTTAPSPAPPFNEAVLAKRNCVEYWTLSLEAHAALQDTRPDGPRDVDAA